MVRGKRHNSFFALGLLALCGWGVPEVWGAEAIPAEESLANRESAQWIEMLDSASCRSRNAAWESLCLKVQNLQDEEEAADLLLFVRKSLSQINLSFEVQDRLLVLEKNILQKTGKKIFAEKEKETAKIPVRDLEKLPCWAMLWSDEPARRNWAVREIRNFCESENLSEMIRILRNLIVDEKISDDDRMRIWELERSAWKKRLESGEMAEAPAFSEAQIQKWIGCLASINLPEKQLELWNDLEGRTKIQFSLLPHEDPLGGDGLTFLMLGGEEEKKRGLEVWKTVQLLEEALICRESRELVLELIHENLESAKVTPAGTILLKRLAFLAKPCMTAEYWMNGKMQTAQFLQIGVPQDCGIGISFFDSLVDGTVHCQGGTNLIPGNYPTEIAILHPNQPQAFFHLVPLDTPEKKLLYPYLTGEDEGERWRTISEKTLTQMEEKRAAEKRLLRESELRILHLLEPKLISGWAVRWMCELEDGEIPDSKNAAQELTHHAFLCNLLFAVGTKEAMPGLLQVLEKGIWRTRMRERVRIDYAAALKISKTQDWDGREEWLKSLLSKDIPMIEGRGGSIAAPMLLSGNGQLKFAWKEIPVNENSETAVASLAATAAALLLEMRQEPLEGLVEALPFRTGLVYYAFVDKESEKTICEKLLKED